MSTFVTEFTFTLRETDNEKIKYSNYPYLTKFNQNNKL